MQQEVYLNKSKILFLLLLFCCVCFCFCFSIVWFKFLFVFFRDSTKVLVRNMFPYITCEVSDPVKFTMLRPSCVCSKFE
jgi:hypothetical protein